MKRTRRQHFLGIAGVLLLSAFLFQSCRQIGPQGKKAHVMLVLGYDSGHYMYKEFLDEVKNTMREHHYKADLRVVYMDMENTQGDFRTILLNFRDSLRREDWAPDLMLFEGDRPARLLITEPYDTIFDFNHIPIVLGALHHPNAWANLNGHANVARWSDPMDFCANIDLAVHLSEVNCVDIELDYGPQDQQLREELSQQISRPPYVNNMDFHETQLDEKSLNTVFKDSILIQVYSAQEPWQNKANTDSTTQENDWETGKDNLMHAYSLSWQHPQLVVKKDIYADLLATKSGRPQYTAVKSDFGNGTGNYLAGYFASYRTIAHDITETGIKILEGAQPNKIEMKEHKKEYWMDYTAMQKLGMKYEDYADDFKIINAPYFLTNRQEFLITLSIFALLILVIAGFLVALLRKIRQHIIQRDIDRLEESVYITKLCLQGADSYPLTDKESILQYAHRASAGQEEEIRKIETACDQAGEHRILLSGDIAEKGKEEWWEFRFIIRENQEVNGVVLNVNEREKQKSQMELALEASEESKKKENFMLKTSREISKPLEAIKDYCDKLTDGNPTAQEKQRLAEQISKNSEQLTTIINDILLFSRIESGRQQYFMKQIDIEYFMKNFLDEWRDHFPEYLELKEVKGRPCVNGWADSERLRDILNQFMSNAVKFTDMGSISVGWRYHLGSQALELFIEDTGVGISEKKQKTVFSMFWKNNDFMPGVGLGLNIAKRLAENLDGKIVVSSQEGVGTRFSVWIKGTLSSR